MRTTVQRTNAATTLPPITAMTVIVVFEIPPLLVAPCVDAAWEAVAEVSAWLVTVLVKVPAAVEDD